MRANHFFRLKSVEILVEGISNETICCRIESYNSKICVMLFRPRISKIVCGNTLLLTPHRNIRFATKKINLLDGFEKMEAPEEDMHVEPPELRVDTVYIGKEFELQVIKTLSKFGLNIKVASI